MLAMVLWENGKARAGKNGGLPFSCFLWSAWFAGKTFPTQDLFSVFAVLTPGYNFDGAQNPPVQRVGDAPSSAPVLSVPTFYGGHGYGSTLPNLSAIFFAAGPDIRHGVLNKIRNIDITPTIDKILGVKPDDTVQGKVIEGLLKCDLDH